LTVEAIIRGFEAQDAVAVRELFVLVNRLLAPPALHDAFEAYIARSLAEEMDRVTAYYAERSGGFWVASNGAELAGMFGLEAAAPDAMELRRMYVSPFVRRRGIGGAMLRFAEDEARRRGARRLELSTSELQPAAVGFYRAAGYRLVREAVAEAVSNKTVGGGIRRFHFEKALGQAKVVSLGSGSAMRNVART
jgi:GNAT superfamily N-acetyltransferase